MSIVSPCHSVQYLSTLSKRNNYIKKSGYKIYGNSSNGRYT